MLHASSLMRALFFCGRAGVEGKVHFWKINRFFFGRLIGPSINFRDAFGKFERAQIDKFGKNYHLFSETTLLIFFQITAGNFKCTLQKRGSICPFAFSSGGIGVQSTIPTLQLIEIREATNFLSGRLFKVKKKGNLEAVIQARCNTRNIHDNQIPCLPEVIVWEVIEAFQDGCCHMRKSDPNTKKYFWKLLVFCQSKGFT